MADNVKVSGGGDFDGAILENAATEKTLRDLVNKLDPKNKNGMAAKIDALYQKTLKANTKALEENRKDLETFNKDLKELDEKSKKLKEHFGEIAGFAVGTLFSGIATAGSLMLGMFTDSIDAFRQTSSVGASFNNDLVGLRLAAAEAAMPLDMFTEAIKSNSSTLVMLGGTVTQGAKAFADMSKDLRTGPFGEQLMMMGFTMKDINDGLLSYIDIQAKLGRLQGKTQPQLIKETQSYLLELDKLTKITGLSRQQLEEQMAKDAADPIFAAMQAALSPDELKKSQANIAAATQMGGENLNKMLKEITLGIPDPEALMFQQMTGISQEMAEAITMGKVDLDKSMDILQKGAAKAANSQMMMGKQGGIMAKEVEGVAGASTAIRKVLAFNKADVDAAAKEQKRKEGINQGLLVLDQAFQKMKDDILVTFINSGVFKMVQDSLAGLTKMFMDNKEDIVKSIKTMVETFSGFATTFMQNVKANGLFSAIKDAFLNIISGMASIMWDGVKAMFKGMFTKGASPEQSQQKTDNTAKIGRNTQMIAEMEKMKQDPTLKGNEEAIRAYESRINKLKGENDNLIESNKTLNASMSEIDWGFIAKGVAGATAAFGAFVGISKLLSLAFEGLIPGGKAFETLSQSVSKGVASFTPAIPVILSFGAAIGMGAGGLGYLMNGVSAIIEQTANAFDKFPTSLKKFEDLDVEKLKKIGPVLNMFTGTSGGLLAGAGNALETWSKGNASEAFANSFNAIANLDGNKLDNIVTGIGKIKTVIGEDFGKQADGVNAFSKAINNLIEKLKTLEDTMKNSSNAAETLKATNATVASANAISSSTIGSVTTDQQKQLNTLVEQLIELTKEIKDSNKGILDTAKGRNVPI